jgi:hypothetical protein
MRNGFELVRTPGLALDACGASLLYLPKNATRIVQDVRGEEGEGCKFDLERDIKIVRVNSLGGTLNRFQACLNILKNEQPLGNRALRWMVNAANNDELKGDQERASEVLRATGHWFLSGTWSLDDKGEIVAWGVGNDPEDQNWDCNHWYRLAREVDAHFAMLCWA